jgi:uncharacterized paraquat-inducible protein A
MVIPMKLALYVIGAIVFIISIIAGFLSGLLGVLIGIAGGISAAIIFFALAKIIENQETILYKLVCQEEAYRKSCNKEKKVCPKCNYEYENDYTSCPRCGYRD